MGRRLVPLQQRDAANCVCGHGAAWPSPVGPCSAPCQCALRAGPAALTMLGAAATTKAGSSPASCPVRVLCPPAPRAPRAPSASRGAAAPGPPFSPLTLHPRTQSPISVRSNWGGSLGARQTDSRVATLRQAPCDLWAVSLIYKTKLVVVLIKPVVLNPSCVSPCPGEP